MPTLMQSVKRLRDRWILPSSGPVRVEKLNQRFQPVPSGSMRSLLLKMNTLADEAKPVGGGTHPYYRRPMPAPHDLIDFASDTTHIDFTHAHMPAYPPEPVELSAFTSLFDARAAAAVSNLTGFFRTLRVSPGDPPHAGTHLEDVLLELKTFWYDGEEVAPLILIPNEKCLAALAYPDYFPEVDAHPESTVGSISAGEKLRRMVSDAILAANPGWCGTFGPGVDGTFVVVDKNRLEGNYDMSQMHLLQIAYRYYDELSPTAQEWLITSLLARGTIHRPNLDDTFTSGGMPNDWSRAGYLDPADLPRFLDDVIRIGETENHVLTILTARYLTNQLLYQRVHDSQYDNRRNGEVMGGPHCTELVLALLRNILRDDFSEYNAKPYQTETRSALLNLCNYAYDHEVRLAARMVLDYVSAHIAVSSNDLRRMVPFRRLNKDERVTRLSGVDRDFMDVGLLEPFLGADPMAEPFAIQAGNIRAYERPWQARPWNWGIAGDGGAAVMEALSDYRLPPSIHDLFVNDLHRRFFQRLHRVRKHEVENGRNCDNMEIYAGSSSYLITAGGSPATYAISPYVLGLVIGDQTQQLGVAVTTSFMPTGLSYGNDIHNNAKDLIQFGAFSDMLDEVANYGVAPDFACGHKMHLPLWVLTDSQPYGQFFFRHQESPIPLPGVVTEPPGFYLAIFNEGEFSLLEAFDTWLHPGVTFHEFKRRVKEANPSIKIQNNVEFEYKTQNGNHLHVVIWKDGKRDDDATYGARILRIEYGTGDSRDPMDSQGDAGNITDKFLNGTVMNSKEEGVVEITNHFLDTTIRLDMSDQLHPKRTSETGEVEEAGSNHEVWVDFGWTGPSEGDFFRPFNTISAAAAAVADGGVIRIMPGWTTEKPSFQKNKRIRLVAPIGGVSIGVR